MAPKLSNPKEQKNQHIQVAVRCRPLNANEKKNASYSVVDLDSELKSVTVKGTMNPFATQQKSFSYDRVFGPQSKQIEVYKSVVSPVLEEVLMGYNCTIFAYGQTGSGKTYTMEGERTESANLSWEDDPQAGVIPRALHQLFTRLNKLECEYSLRVSYLEIYNEELIDLLGADSMENPRLKIYEDNTKKDRVGRLGSCVIQGLEEVVVNNKTEVYAILEKGRIKRQTASTLMNAHSSRSHSVFMVTVHIKENTVEGEELLKTGKLNLVDLAGSENIGRSGAVDKRAREAGNINQSLLTLGRVITALVEHAPHVPYRESKLTRLLQDSLGGRTKTSIIATISPASSNLEETLSTLDYAHRAKNIQNKPEINQKLTKKALLKEYTEEIERLRKDLVASRDKSGVFLASENYEAIINKDLTQQGMIKDLDEKLSFLQTEMIKVEELFSDTKDELEQTSKELEVTTKNLEETSEHLSNTRKNLRKTTQDRDEQIHLVHQHVKTETKLHGQASELLHTTNESTSDVDGLHAKVDRKTKVQEHNESVQERFCQKSKESFQSVKQEIQEFSETHLSLSGIIANGLGTTLSTALTRIESVCNSLANLKQNVTDQYTDLHELESCNMQETSKVVSEIKEHTTFSKENAIQLQSDFQSNTLNYSIINLEEILSTILEEIKSCKSQSDKLVQQQNKDLGLQNKANDFDQPRFTEHKAKSQEMCESLTRNVSVEQEALHQLQTELITKLEDHENHLEEAFEKQTQLEKQVDNELLENIAAMLEGMRTTKSKTRQQHLSSARQTIQEQKQYVTRSVQERNTCLKDHNDEINKANERICEQFTEVYNHTVNSANKVIENTETLQEGTKKIREESTSFLNTYTENINTDSEKTLTLLEANSQTIKRHKEVVSDTIQSHITSQNIRADDICSQLCTHKQLLHNDVDTTLSHIAISNEAFKEWTATLNITQEDGIKEVEIFKNEELTKDMPTGTTPKRREFNYPKILTKTGRHSTILKEFRSEYILEEAMNLPVPDDSFTESELGNPIPALVIDEDCEEDGEGNSTQGSSSTKDMLNTSGDSAISSVSSTFSSVTSKADKENKMPPPPRGSRKANTKSVSAISGKSGMSKTPNKSTPLLNKPVEKRTPSNSRISENKTKSRLPLKSSN